MPGPLGMLKAVRLGSGLLATRLPQPARAMAAQRSVKLWIDSDAGVDDAQGVLLALAHRQTEVHGVSAVHGNASPQQVARNVQRLLVLAGRTDVPVHLGADKALDGTSGSAPQVSSLQSQAARCSSRQAADTRRPWQLSGLARTGLETDLMLSLRAAPSS